MRILCWAQTDVGQKRDHNEDSFLVAADVGLYVVADGMGGHAGGDQASQMAVSVLHETIRKAGLGDRPDGATLGEEPAALTVLREGARAAGEIIFDLAQQNPHLSGMGTTLTGLLFHSGRVHLAHVGDSRAFLFRDGRIEQLSEDHSWINEQVKAGLITDEEARHSKFKHIITRSVGFEREVAVDVMSLPVLMGDCYVVCSDGLSNYMENDELGRLLTANYYGSVPGLLTDIANERGGDDNITVLIVYIANDTGQPRVLDLSKPDPSRQVTVPGDTAAAATEGTTDHTVESNVRADVEARVTSDASLAAVDHREDAATPEQSTDESTPEAGHPAANESAAQTSPEDKDPEGLAPLNGSGELPPSWDEDTAEVDTSGITRATPDKPTTD